MWYELLPGILNMSLTGSLVILAVLAARLLLRRAPKVFSYVLWAAVLFRLLCPVSFTSDFSVFSLSGTTTQSGPVEYFQYNGKTEKPMLEFDAGDPAPAAGTERDPAAADPEDSEPRTPNVYLPAALAIWLCGVAAMLTYSVISCFRLRRRLVGAVCLRDNIYLADGISSPFVMGLFRPKIYLPSALSGREREYILLHEQHHLRRCDHAVKLLSFAALCVHWFNPLVWLAFVLSGRDMEMSCDEAVIKKLGGGIRAEYSASLLSLATGRRIVSGTPLAFGEGDTGGRIRNVLRYKKPACWVTAAAVTACIAVALCLVANPTASRTFPMEGTQLSDLDPQYILAHIAAVETLDDTAALNVSADDSDLRLTGDFDFVGSETIRFFYTEKQQTYSARLRLSAEKGACFVANRTGWPTQERFFKLQHYLEALQYLPQERARQLSPDADRYLVVLRDDGAPEEYDRVITYSPDGAGDLDGWFIHLELQPLHEQDGAYHGTEDEVIHLFYGRAAHTIPGGSLIRTYAYDGGDIIHTASVSLYDSGEFEFIFSPLSSTVGYGRYTLENGLLTLKTSEGGFTYVFHMKDDTLVFDGGASSAQTWYSGITDGAVLRS